MVQFTYFVNNIDYSQTGATFDYTAFPSTSVHGTIGRTPTGGREAGVFRIETWIFVFCAAIRRKHEWSLFYIVCRNPENPGDAFTNWAINNVYFDHNQPNPIKTDIGDIVHSTHVRLLPIIQITLSLNFSNSGRFTESPLLRAFLLHWKNGANRSDSAIVTRVRDRGLLIFENITDLARHLRDEETRGRGFVTSLHVGRNLQSGISSFRLS
jgi:hypothetical protein